MPTLTRRTLLVGVTASAIAGIPNLPHLVAQTNGYLGQPINDLVADLNVAETHSVEVVDTRHVSLVPHSSNQSPSVPKIFVQADLDGRVEFIEFDRSSLPDGMPDPENPNWRANALPGDAAQTLKVSTPGGGSTGLQFVVEMFSSQWLRQETGRSGNGIYVWQTRPAFSARPMEVLRLDVATESHQPFDGVPTGSSTQLLGSTDSWQSAFGDPGAHQSGISWQVGPDEYVNTVSGQTVESIWASLDGGPGSLDHALMRIGEFLPGDAVLQQTFLLFPTPTGPGAVRIQHWHLHAVNRDCVVTIEYNGDESDGSVTKYSLQIA